MQNYLKVPYTLSVLQNYFKHVKISLNMHLVFFIPVTCVGEDSFIVQEKNMRLKQLI